ncbi:MAG: cyclophilin-like fold protein [Thermomicrobiales bacterium]|nr:cyclophilin-like fold protein [Thermomicrobiales bacterium]
MPDKATVNRRWFVSTSSVGVAMAATRTRAQESSLSEPTLLATPTGEVRVQITLTLGDTVLTATMNDSQTSREFVGLLPLTLTLSDYNQTEKISDLPGPLTVDDSLPGFDPSPGDITYYAPWGNLAIFYRDFGPAAGLVHLGTIDEGWEALERTDPFEVTFALLEREGTAVSVVIGDVEVDAHLFDNPAAHDLISMLPLSLTFRDYAGQEKLAELPRSLSMDGAPSEASAMPGDITYYAPDQVIVLLYEPIDSFPGIVPIGRFDGSIQAITDQRGDFHAQIRMAAEEQSI